MSYLNKISCFAFLSVTLMACNIAPQKIKYGVNHCNFCDMTVVDKTHAAEYVTKKGKSYVFDSIECMLHELNEKNNEQDLAFILVADYQKPAVLIKAKEASYLVTDKIKSPMGANLSAFNSLDTAIEMQQKLGGAVYTWQQIKTAIKK
ncbi:nitrous oxide reductase accessory protein NosL [Tenacibaculum sp. UWU-22]|uniref:nitrous oxide reductase accessory protein NosL n=1 Tax=Tenacibaculum sp. UWU-22 TaxID=3234187 RepID=UPI0034DB296D